MVQFLDCTLRDGAHVNSGNFGYENIKRIADGLTRANIDIVELGFLKNVEYNPDISSYPRIEKAYGILAQLERKRGVEYALMARADEYDLDSLSECDGRIKYVRVAFYYDFLDNAMEFAKKVMEKGYQVTFNVINTPGSTIKELGRVVDYANKIMPSVVTIVDTFGVLSMEELKSILDEYDSRLDLGIKIGLHVHENLALAFSLAQGFIDYARKGRGVVIDGSLMGMGRIPGNLCTELMTDYLNVRLGKGYGLWNILKLIGDIIAPIKEKMPWGYSPAYFLSAKYKIHRSYSEYLVNRNIPVHKMAALLGQVDREHAGKFDVRYMDSIINSTQQ